MKQFILLAVVVLVSGICGADQPTTQPASTPATQPDRPKLKVDPKIRYQFQVMDQKFKLTYEQKARLIPLLLEQRKLSEEFTRKDKPRILEMRNTLNSLKADIQKLEALERDMRAQQAKAIDDVLTPEQKIIAQADEFILRGRWQEHIDDLNNEEKARVQAAALEASEKIAKAQPDQRKKVKRQALAEMNERIGRVITPERIKRKVVRGIVSRLIRSLRLVKLTDEQIENIEKLAREAYDEKAALDAKVQKAQETLAELRDRQRSAPINKKLRNNIYNDVLTAEQRDTLQAAREAEKARREKSRRPKPAPAAVPDTDEDEKP